MEHFPTAQLNAKALGVVHACDSIINLDYQQLLAEIDEYEPKRSSE